MTIPRSADVLVIGLGPAGAAASIRLARAGFNVAAIDRATFPRDKICSEYMSPETLHQLEQLGILDRVEAAGAVPLDGVRVVGPRGSHLTGLFAATVPPRFRATGLSISRRALDQVLVDAAHEARACIIDRAQLVGLLYERHAVAGAVFRHDGRLHEIRSRLVIGADGLHSKSAQLLGARRHDPPARYGFVAHVADVAGMTATAEMHVEREGYVGLNAIGGGLTNVAVVVPAHRAARARGDPTGFWRHALETVPGVRGRVPATVARGVLATGPFAVRSRVVVADGALLTGDAAEFFDPFTGDGICTALRGSALAAAAAADALSDPGPVTAARLGSYRVARRRAFAGKWLVERLIGYGMLAPRLFDRAVRRLEERGLADTLVGVTGQYLPAREVLRPGFLAAMVF